jgi:hypothetical protein
VIPSTPPLEVQEHEDKSCPVPDQRVSHPVVLTSSDDVVDHRRNLPGAISTHHPQRWSSAVNPGIDGHGPWCLKYRRRRHSWIDPRPHMSTMASRLDRPRALVSSSAPWLNPSGGQGASGLLVDPRRAVVHAGLPSLEPPARYHPHRREVEQHPPQRQ